MFNFHRYIDVLIQLTKVEGTRHGKLIAAQMLDVPIRVKAVRSYAVQCLVSDNNSLIYLFTCKVSEIPIRGYDG